MNKAVIMAIVGIILVIAAVFGFAVGSREMRAHVAQSKGDSFVHKLYSGYQILGESCQGEDTDADSYVSCDFRISSASGTEQTIHLQCPTIWKSLLGNSCKESRYVVAQ